MAPAAAPAAQPGTAPAAPVGVNRYVMRQRIVALGQDFTINTAAGQPAFKVHGKVRLIKEALTFSDLRGNVLYKLDERVIRIRESFDILKPNGQLAAKVHNAIIDPLRERFTIEIPGQPNMTTLGKSSGPSTTSRAAASRWRRSPSSSPGLAATSTSWTSSRVKMTS
jgi:hypothetical protein